MKIEFDQDYLFDLYTKGKTENRKFRFQPQLIKQYIKTVTTLKQAPDAEFLYTIKSLHYEKKSGILNDVEAVWINNQCRLEFKTRIEDDDSTTFTICTITDISNHYKK